jgi:hypothetical protein
MVRTKGTYSTSESIGSRFRVGEPQRLVDSLLN